MTTINPDLCQEVRLTLISTWPNGRRRRTMLATVDCPHCGEIGKGNVREMNALAGHHRTRAWNEFQRQNPDWEPQSRLISDMYPGLRL